jgi:hypothetical protein
MIKCLLSQSPLTTTHTQLHHTIWLNSIDCYYTQSLNNPIHLDDNNIVQWICLNPITNIGSLDKENWHFSIFTSRYIFAAEIPNFLQSAHKTTFSFFFCDLRNWQKQTNKQTHTISNILHNRSEIHVALILFLSSTHIYYHTFFLGKT